MVKKLILAAGLALLLSACAAQPTKPVSCNPIIVKVPIAVYPAPAVIEQRPALPVQTLTTKSTSRQIFVANRDTIVVLVEYAKQLECALAPFQMNAGQKVNNPDCLTKPSSPPIAKLASHDQPTQ